MAIREVVVGETPKRRKDSAIWSGVSMHEIWVMLKLSGEPRTQASTHIVIRAKTEDYLRMHVPRPQSAFNIIVYRSECCSEDLHL